MLQVYKCKRCRRTLATSHNLLPHVYGETPDWRDQKWSLPAEEVRRLTSLTPPLFTDKVKSSE